MNACIKAIKVDLGWLKSHTSTCLMRKNRRKGWGKRQRRWELTEVMSVWGVWKVPETFLGRKSRPPRTQCVAAGLLGGIFFPTSSQLLKASSACIQSFGVNNRADAILQHLPHISSSSFFLIIAPWDSVTLVMFTCLETYAETEKQTHLSCSGAEYTKPDFFLPTGFNTVLRSL